MCRQDSLFQQDHFPGDFTFTAAQAIKIQAAIQVLWVPSPLVFTGLMVFFEDLHQQ